MAGKRCCLGARSLASASGLPSLGAPAALVCVALSWVSTGTLTFPGKVQPWADWGGWSPSSLGCRGSSLRLSYVTVE